MPATLARFAIAGTPAAYYQRAIALSTVMPLMGRARGPVAIAQAALGLVDRWRARVFALADSGWEMTRTHTRTRGGHDREAPPCKWRMLNCRPAMFAPTPITPSCCVRSICPHCWGRQAADQWQEIDERLFGGDDDGPGSIMFRRVKWYRVRPATDDGTPGLEAWLDNHLARVRRPDYAVDRGFATRRADLYGLARAGCEGGFETISFDPEVDDHGTLARWSIRVRQVLFVPAARFDAFVSNLWATRGERSHGAAVTVSCRGKRRPVRRREVLGAVASACRYPTFQMYGDPACTLAALAARRGRRLSTRFGWLYG